MNGFIKKSVGTLTLGEKLRKLRSERRMSLNEVSRFTKIQVRYLECLEDGQYGKLPADVYVRGFLKSYAEFLGVNENILYKLYDKEKGIKNNLDKSKQPAQKKFESINMDSFVFTPRLAVIFFSILAVFGGFFYLYREFGAFANMPRLVVLSPDKNYTTAENSVIIEGVTDRDARVFINEQAVLVNDDGKFRESLPVQFGNNIISVKAMNRFNKEKNEIITVKSEYQEKIESEPLAGQEKIEAGQKGLEMEIWVKPGPVWLSVEADGSLVFSGALEEDVVKKFNADKGIIVDSGKANGTFARINGEERGALGASAGAVRGVVFAADKQEK